MTSLARRTAVLSGTLALVLLCSAHVGSPDTFFEGKAGPYPVRVIIRSPVVIPARAEIVVRVTGSGITRVTATPKIWNGGDRGAPPPDNAARVPGDSALWSLQLWIMRQGSYAVLVRVEGAAGGGTAVVPYTAVATSVLRMNGAMAVTLSALGIFLVAGLVTIAGAAAREATLAPGDVPAPDTERRVRRVRRNAVVAIVLVLAGGRAWWLVEDRAYAAAVFKPVASVVSIRTDTAPPQEGSRRRVTTRTLRVASAGEGTRRFRWTTLLPDHGKLMHLFLVRAGDLGAMAHLHPVPVDPFSFEVALPPLPPGPYHLFADVVFESGFVETIVQTVTVDAPGAPWGAHDRDDAVFLGGSGTPARFDDGSTLSWEGAATPHVTNADATLRFTLRDAKGAPLTVEPYLGMAAHAVVVRTDGSVYVHLHPLGTASTGAQQALLAWTAADTAPGAIRAKVEREQRAMAEMPGTLPGEFAFPYAFPTAGRYRVWVQFRRGGAIRTAAVDVEVREPGAR
ncbi:MAG: hypothetical protein ACHQQ3_12975 [Gemmatimonadales bacterium]